MPFCVLHGSSIPSTITSAPLSLVVPEAGVIYIDQLIAENVCHGCALDAPPTARPLHHCTMVPVGMESYSETGSIRCLPFAYVARKVDSCLFFCSVKRVLFKRFCRKLRKDRHSTRSRSYDWLSLAVKQPNC
jgi:hypothetical protein